MTQLSPAQQAVVDKMREGWELRSGTYKSGVWLVDLRSENDTEKEDT